MSESATVTCALRAFLAHQSHLPGSDLRKRYLKYGPENLETQVNAAQDGGEAVEGHPSTWTDLDSTWFNIRIPKNANSEPSWNDYLLHWAPEEHCEAIGSTGWDWQARRSRWVGYDVDAIIGHSEGVGVSDAEITRIKQAAQSLPYVEVRQSTGGKGIHLYVIFNEEGIPTGNHTEHAELALIVLERISEAFGFDLANAVDACGQNMWLWHRKITGENQGLALLKAATQELSVADLPSGWEKRVKSKTPKKSKKSKKKNQEPDESEQGWDETHHEIFQAMTEKGYPVVLQTLENGKVRVQLHTRGLEHDHTTHHRIGLFSTSAPGTDLNTPNAYAYPLRDGRLAVYRHGDTKETPDWRTTPNGHVCIHYNAYPEIYVRTPLAALVRQSIHALRADPNTYQKASVLVEVVRDVEKPKQSVFDNGSPQFRAIAAATLTEKLSECACYKRWSKTEEAWVDCDPPEKVVEAVLRRAVLPGIPVVTNIINAPFLRGRTAVSLSVQDMIR